ncbi:MAG TPA: ATP-dependent DNA helicase RecG [Xanthobacteraceae bacterium]|nr:ATP-dependent DNA helicase RecG [Xanthobacteraceae bacterium]
MRPPVLIPLFAGLGKLTGIGPKFLTLFGKLLGRNEPRLLDALFHLPHSAIDRRERPKLRDVVPETIVTVEIHIDKHKPAPPRGRAPHRVFAHDDTNDIELVFFGMPRERIERMLPAGEKRYVSGKAVLYDGRLQMTHPDHITDEAGLARVAAVEPVYPLTQGLSNAMVRRACNGALGKVPPLPEWIDEAFLRARKYDGFGVSIRRAHIPAEPQDVEPASQSRSRLGYDELLAHQLALALVRSDMRREPGRSHSAAGELQAKIEAALPFSLTGSQRKAIEEIKADLTSSERMLRLLQGDVGSGKTLVALLAAAHVIEGGKQAAIMAPTEVLARQHLQKIAPLAAAAGIRAEILTGRERGTSRKQLLADLGAGDVHLLIGTHAVFQDDVVFDDLALAVVDEQHRFGVHQRLALAGKGNATDVLVMTATPIPRTLVLTYFGDMDVSELREKPAGRQPIETVSIALERLHEVVEAVQRAIESGARAYWICPLVEESEEVDLADAEARFAHLQGIFGTRAGLVHGRMKAAEKDEAMARFASGSTPLLVATTVVEVGVDVPEATVIVIEHAERFGLAQLHQLRGRVGRGGGKSTCLLLYRAPLGPTAKRRIETMRATEDGFRIAEEDLALRGEGEILGTRQSGMPGFKLADASVHKDLLEAARQDAALIVAQDPLLKGKRGEALRLLLHLFEREDAVRLLDAG